MKSVHIFFYGFAVVCLLTLAGLGFYNYYSFIFARRVEGIITKVDRVEVNAFIQQTGERMDPQVFSFAVGIRQDDGEIITASAEDRQWAAAQRGLCAVATFFPYEPWKLMKGGTYYGARLDKLYECPEKAAALLNQSAQSQPAAAPAPTLQPPMQTPTPAPSKIPTH